MRKRPGNSAFSAATAPSRGRSFGVVAGDRDLFGSGRSLTSNVELSPTSCAAKILYSDPGFSKAITRFKMRLYGQSEEWYRYNVLEDRFPAGILEQITKQLPGRRLHAGPGSHHHG